MLTDERSYGFVVIDGHGVLLAEVSGTSIIEKKKKTVYLPNKMSKGGQSSVRFARLAEEARHNYITQVIEMILQTFGRNKELVLAGSGPMKDNLNNRIQDKVKILALIDVAYGMRQGLNETIEKSSHILSELNIVQDKKILSSFFEEINKGSNKVCYGEKVVKKALTDGVVQLLLLSEDLKFTQLEEYTNLAKSKAAEIKTLSSISDLGLQFNKGFGGYGAILRYPLIIEEEEEKEEDFDFEF